MVEAPDGPPSRRDRLDWAIGDLIGWGWAWMVRRGAIGPQSRRARRFGAFGENSAVTFPTLALYNEHYIHLGSGTIVGPQCSLSVGMLPGQRMVSDPVITIGDRCVIGRGSSIVGHLSITIGDDVFTGPNIYVTDQNHVYRDPDVPIGRQVPTEAAVEIGSGCWLGTGVVVLPGVTIGSNVVIGAGAVVNRDLPDHSVAVGNPARVVRRFLPDRGWVQIGRDGDAQPSPGSAP